MARLAAKAGKAAAKAPAPRMAPASDAEPARKRRDSKAAAPAGSDPAARAAAKPAKRKTGDPAGKSKPARQSGRKASSR
jgi:hypothetical protein